MRALTINSALPSGVLRAPAKPGLAIALLAAACGSHPEAPPVASPRAPHRAEPAPVELFAALDLGFEHVSTAHTGPWKSTQPQTDWDIDTTAHGGAHALRIHPSSGFVAVAATTTEMTVLRGKHVRLHGWIRSADLTDWAGLWVRADAPDGNSPLDNMQRHAVRGTTPWTETSVEIDVPDNATRLLVGGLVSGGGTAWFDDLRLEVTVEGRPHPITLEGTVVTAAKQPIGGAEVALVNATSIERHVTADAHGHWSFSTMSGTWGLSASTPAGVGFIDGVRYDADTRAIELVIKDGEVAVAGHTTAKPLAGAFVALSMPSEHNADIFALPVAADGTFGTRLPRGPTYAAEVIDKGLGQVVVPVTGDRVEIAVPFSPLAPAPQEVVEWIAANAIALTTVEAEHGFDDMAPLAKVVGGAHVVALGEATHGTREFFQMKHRMLEFLVAKLGFTTFAIEANQPECRAIDDYVVNGVGDAKTALAGIYFWTWNTEEVLAMIEWMRKWNADPKHVQKVHFTGFDMQTSARAHSNVAAYLGEVGADAALTAPTAVLDKDSAMTDVAKLSADERAKIKAGLDAIDKAFEANQRAWKAKKTKLAFDDARHDVTVLVQALAMYGATERDQLTVRDQSMADNLDWLRKRAKGGKVMVWAHNGHIANTLVSFSNMGSHLRKRYGRDYENLGFVFADGSFQAMDGGETGGMILRELTVGPAPDTDGSSAFLATGKPLLVVDLHAVPKTGVVHDWFTSAHPFRDIGAVFFNERQMAQPATLTELYDAVIFVAHTTRARPVKH